MVVAGRDQKVERVAFGYPTRAAALGALEAQYSDWHEVDWYPDLVARLRAFASGQSVDFRDITLELSHLTPFQKRVVGQCRKIGYGRTRSYGELAELVGSPRAARAVGSTMAVNRFPIIVPCHRVINSDGSPGNYSALDGPRTKVRLLALERREAAATSAPRPRKPAPIGA
jgi:methylated-DNA-[protein]-cysteine S-methyltransferase